MRVLLSINPVHVESIILGRKRFEFRRRIFARDDVCSAMIYSTKPVGKIVGEFEIVSVLQGTPDALWAKTKIWSGITRAYFDGYFEGRSNAYALEIGKVRVYDRPLMPADLIEGFTPPQSFIYLSDSRLSDEFAGMRRPA